MGEYVQAHSPLNPHTEEGPQEHYVHDKSALEELCDKEEGLQEHFPDDKSASEELCDEEEG